MGYILNNLSKTTLKEALGRMHIVLEGQHPDRPTLIAIAYRYNLKVTLCFIITKNTGSIRKSKPYEIKFTDSHRNVYVRLVDRLSVISDFFKVSNCVDKHNQARQFELALEKKWETRDPFFQLTITMISITYVNT